MVKSFEWFCRERVILGQQVNPTSTEDLERFYKKEFEEPTNVSVKYYVCVRLGNKLIDNKRLYSKLGLVPQDFSPMNEGVSMAIKGAPTSKK